MLSQKRGQKRSEIPPHRWTGAMGRGGPKVRLDYYFFALLCLTGAPWSSLVPFVCARELCVKYVKDLFIARW